jgi:predicted DNA-binding transcriptional regulator AlpA
VNGVKGPVLLDTDQAAKYTTLTRKTLERLRWAGGGPSFLKLSGLVRYTTEDLDQWINSRRRRSTSDPGPDAR